MHYNIIYTLFNVLKIHVGVIDNLIIYYYKNNIEIFYFSCEKVLLHTPMFSWLIENSFPKQ